MAGGRPPGAKTRCGGMWTEAKFNSFIRGNLRKATLKWAPIQEALRLARISRGYYRCAGCGESVTATKVKDGRRVKNAIVDHVTPIVSPSVGFISWDSTINRMFCEIDNLQILCLDCHTVKCDMEKKETKERRQKERESGQK